MSPLPPDPVDDPLARLRRVEQLVDVFADARRRRGAIDAEELRVLARVSGLVPRRDGAIAGSERSDIARRCLVSEIATATRLSEYAVTRLLFQAVDLCSRFAAGVDALEKGTISLRHLEIIQDAGTAILDDDDRSRFLNLALERAATLTPTRLRPVAVALAEHFVAVPLAERAETAAARRSVEIIDLSDGMAMLSALLPATLAHGIDDRLTEQAREVIAQREVTAQRDTEASSDTDPEAEAETSDTRTLAQIRSDVFTDLLLTGAPDPALGSGLAAIQARVQVSVPVLTVLGHSAAPCLLTGHGPIDPATARELAAAAPEWERVMSDPITGAVLATERYRPHSALRRFLAARDEHCRFPGCRRAVRRCDIDHTLDFAHGGRTGADNLAHLCRRHHTLKHASAWTVTREGPGVLVWTSPHGRRHTDRPEATVRFVAEPAVLEDRTRIADPRLFSEADPPPF